MTYNERVRLIAEEMAEQEWNDRYCPDEGEDWEEFVDQAADVQILWRETNMYAARIAVARMAEAATEFLGSLSEYGVQKRLSEYGLIPDKTESNV